MLVNAMVDAAAVEFKQILVQFGDRLDLSALTPELAEVMCGCVREALAAGARAAYMAFLYGFETHDDVVRDAHGEVFRFKAVRERDFMTPFGPMRLKRRCYQNKSDTTSYVPLDIAWGMNDQYMMPQVREAVLFSCALVTPEETVQLLEKCALFHPHATTIKHEVVSTGEQIQAHRDDLDRMVRAEEPVPEGTCTLVISADGATMLMKEKGVHFGRVAERPGGSQAGETSTAYRVAMVGSVSHYGVPKEEGQTPERLQSRYVAHMPETGCPTFKRLLEAEVDDAVSRAPADAARILLLDGSRELWAYFDKDPRYDGFHRCIDYWHAVEHLSAAAEAMFGSGKKARTWYDKYRHLLRDSDNGAQQIVRSMDYHAKRQTRSQTSTKHVNEHRTYFKRNGHRMTYAAFRANGWPIGSGPIEAACKTLIKTRMGRSGMRWTRPGGRNILDLRTYVKSKRWDKVWKHIKHQAQAA